MRVFLSGATGYVGSEVARRLVARGDQVRALVPVASRAGELRRLGVEVVEGDLSDEGALVAACNGVHAVVHAAALHAVGAPAERRDDLVDVNVRGTERMLGAALTAGVRRAVLVSSLTVLGDTGGRVADETWTRDPAQPWSSVYEETRYVAHWRAQEISARGLPLVTVQPGAVYGPDGPGEICRLVGQLLDGRMRAVPFPELGLCPVHRDDVAAGVLLALDVGVPGEAYVLGGEPVRLRDVLAEAAAVSGRRLPRLRLPAPLLRALSPLGGTVGPVLGLPPNFDELVRAYDGVTFWASSDKARTELGWRSRTLRQGLAELVLARSAQARVPVEQGS